MELNWGEIVHISQKENVYDLFEDWKTYNKETCQEHITEYNKHIDEQIIDWLKSHGFDWSVMTEEQAVNFYLKYIQ